MSPESLSRERERGGASKQRTVPLLYSLLIFRYSFLSLQSTNGENQASVRRTADESAYEYYTSTLRWQQKVPSPQIHGNAERNDQDAMDPSVTGRETRKTDVSNYDDVVLPLFTIGKESEDVMCNVVSRAIVFISFFFAGGLSYLYVRRQRRVLLEYGEYDRADDLEQHAQQSAETTGRAHARAPAYQSVQAEAETGGFIEKQQSSFQPGWFNRVCGAR